MYDQLSRSVHTFEDHGDAKRRYGPDLWKVEIACVVMGYDVARAVVDKEDTNTPVLQYLLYVSSTRPEIKSI